MSGIFGVYYFDARHDADEAMLRRMAAAIPVADPARTRLRASGRCGMGVYVGAPPVGPAPASEGLAGRDGALLACDAELYDRGALLADLGAPAAQESEAELLAALAREGSPERWLGRLAGAFSLAAYDPRRASLVLASDGLGMRRLAYAQTPEALVFSTRIAAILASGLVPVEPLPQAVFDLLFHEMIPTPRTFFRGVHKLPPGHWLEAGAAGVRLHRHWDLRYEEGDASRAELRRSILAAMEQGVSRMLRYDDADALAGAFLSGGIDSSAVSAMIGRVTGSPARTFTIGFSEEGYNETGYARVAARAFGTEQHEYLVTPEDFLDRAESLIAAYDEPFGNSSIVPAFFCAQLARKNGVCVMLAGDGGDELFAGNERYVNDRVFSAYHRLPALLRRGALEPGLEALAAATRSSRLERLARQARRGSTPNPRRFCAYRYASYDRILSGDLLAQIDLEAPVREAEEAFAALAGTSELNKCLYWDMKHTIADNDLRKVSDMCELAGIRVRYPFLSEGLVDVSTRIPARIMLRRLKLRAAFKDAMQGLLPDEILRKQKHGFGLPVGLWLRTHPRVHAYARDVLLDTRTRQRGLFSPVFVEQLLRDREGTASVDPGSTLWLLLVLELWHRNVVDSPRWQRTGPA